MAEDQVDHLAVAEEAVRLNTLAIRQSDEGRRDQALAAAEEAARLYRALAQDFPTMFGPDAERADALAAAIREDRPRAPTAVPAAVRQREPADDTATADVSAPLTARVLGEPTAAATPEPEPPVPPASTTGHLGRSRRRTVVSTTVVVAAVVAVLLGAIGVAGWAWSRPPAPTSVPAAQAPPPAAIPVRQWVAVARIDVAPTGVTLRSAPSTTGAPVGRLTPNADVQIQCGAIGRMTSSDAGERSSSWLRTTAGGYLAAINVEVRGPSPVTNCTPGQPPVALPHHR